ncbi:MAG: PorT family protein, partial [Sphingobacteriaceae bacterium]
MHKLFGIYFLLMLLAYTSYAQENWGGGVDNDDVHFGFGFQFSNTEFKLYKAQDWRTPFTDPSSGLVLTSPLVSISSPVSSSFGLGFIADVRLGNNVNFRATPALVFADRFIDYTYEISAQNTRKTVQS